MAFWDRAKIMAVCSELNVDTDTAEIYLHVHRITKKGKLGPEVFHFEHESDLEILMKEAQLLSKMRKAPKYPEKLRKLYTDPDYSKNTVNGYLNTVKPRYERYGFKDVLRALANR